MDNDTHIYQVTIPFKKPLQAREEIRPVLEEMAKEAETSLGLVCIHICDTYIQHMVFTL